MHTSIRIYKTKIQALDDDTLEKLEKGFIQILRTVPGFHAYRLVDSGNHSVASISFYETEQGAIESVEKSRDWVNQNLAHLVDEPPTVFTGKQIFSELA
jgi:hypothetical protein